MRWCKCNSNCNVLMCETQGNVCICMGYGWVSEGVGSVCVCVCVCVWHCVCVCPLAWSLSRWFKVLVYPTLGQSWWCLESSHQVSLYKSHTTEESLRRRRSDRSFRYCLTMKRPFGTSQETLAGVTSGPPHQRFCVVGHLLHFHKVF